MQYLARNEADVLKVGDCIERVLRLVIDTVLDIQELALSGGGS